MNTSMKKAISLVTCTALAAGCCTMAFAADSPVTKDENVFLYLNPDGSIQRQVVSDWLHSDNGLRGVTDRTSLTDITNLKSDAAYTLNGDALTWDTDDHDVYYQGNSTQTPPVTASIRYEQGEAVQLPEQDAIALSEIIVNASYRQTEPMDDITPYEVDMEGTTYRISLTWSTDTWSATVRGDSGLATLTTKDSCMVAAIIGANDAGGVPARDDASWFGDLSADFSAAAAQMVTTGDINVRSAPSTSSTILMTMPQDSSVAVIGISDEWCEIWYNNQRAYMSSQYLKTVS